MTQTYTGTVGPADEDGYCAVQVFEAGEPVDCQYIRRDQAGQWLAQELDCLNDPRTYGVDLPESALMDAEELYRHRTAGGMQTDYPRDFPF